MFDIVNVLPTGGISLDVRCPHCANSSMVVLDDTGNGVACPMCMAGAVTNQRIRSWTKKSQADQVTWENGLTSSHRWYCSAGSCANLVTSANLICVGCARERDGLPRVPPPPTRHTR